MENAEKEKFELAMLDKYVVLFTCARKYADMPESARGAERRRSPMQHR